MANTPIARASTSCTWRVPKMSRQACMQKRTGAAPAPVSARAAGEAESSHRAAMAASAKPASGGSTLLVRLSVTMAPR